MPPRTPDDIRENVVELYFDKGYTQAMIVDETGLSMRTVRDILHDRNTLEKHKMKVDVKKLRAEIKLANAAEEMVDKQLSIMRKELPDNLLYLVQNSARDLMDRIGLRAKDESSRDVTITFGLAGMPEVNMPEGGGDQEEGEPDADDQS